MKYFKLFTTAICLLIAVSVFAQQHVCGLHDHEILNERLIANKAYLNQMGVQMRDGVSYIPVKYHIVGKSDGSLRIAPKKVLDLHCALNEFYAQEEDGVQFYINGGFNYIDKDIVYSNHGSDGGQNWMVSAKELGSVNIYFPNDATTPGSDPVPGQVTLGYYSPSRDWVVIRKADVNGFSLTAPHELGHYFGMAHPFNGWDNTLTYDPALHGETVGALSPAGVPNEKMDGSNCETAGDMICDTPPSYKFFPWNGCNYDGGARDPDGVLVNPDEYNIMDYFGDECAPKYFSQGQKDLIYADYLQSTGLQTGWTPSSETVEGPVALIQPADDSNTSGYDHVILEWEAAAGADRYLLEIDRLPGFTLDPWQQVVFGTQKDLWGFFEASKSYYWRVTPFNAYNTCAATSDVQKFETGSTTSSEDVLEVNDWSIDPNPVSQNNIMISLDTADSFDAEISIISTMGQTLQTKLVRFNSGNSSVEMSVENIPNGTYLVNIQSGKKLINKKIIVAK